MIRILSMLALLCCFQVSTAYAPPLDATQLFYKVRDKIGRVRDYTADVRMKIDVSFMRIPQLNGKMYFKAPDKMRLERNGGISIMPRNSMNMSLNNLMPAGGVTVIDAGTDKINNIPVRIIKVIPDNDQGDIVLTKIWIDEARLLALRTETTTRDNGTVKMELVYNRYAAYALPDKITFFIDVKDYKIPKGVIMDYEGVDEAEAIKRAKAAKVKKGKIEITYLNYKINTGLSDAIFNQPRK